MTKKIFSKNIVTKKIFTNFVAKTKDMEENPFVFGKAAEGDFFTDRTNDAEHLEANLTHGINTILISPRRWGKTSLVKKVMANVADREDVKIIYVDVFSCKKIITKVSFSPDSIQEYSLAFEFPGNDDAESDILQLPERIARKKNIRIVVCIDEFQQVAEFQDPLTFQKKLRSVWQHQQEVSYCLFGSKRHLMTEIFSDSSNPFYKFGDMIFLKKIPTDEWVPFICRKFSETGKTITEKQAAKICEVTDDLSSYVQHLAWIVWYKAHPVVTNEMVNLSVDELLEQNKVFFQREVEGLTGFQLNFLKALANGVSTGFSKKEVIRKYNLESSANVQGVKKSLQKKDLIDVDGQVVTFNDPIFKLWIKRNIPNL